MEAGRMEGTLELKRHLAVSVACSGKNVGIWQKGSLCQVLSSWWFGEGKGKMAWITKCSSRTVGVLAYNCTTAAVHSSDISAEILHLCFGSKRTMHPPSGSPVVHCTLSKSFCIADAGPPASISS